MGSCGPRPPMVKSKGKVDQLHGLLRQWVCRPDNEQFMYRRSVQLIEAGLGDRAKAPTMFLPLGLVATWHAAIGSRPALIMLAA